MKYPKMLTVAVLLLVLCGFAMSNSFARGGGRNPNPGVLPPWSNAFGDTYSRGT